MNMVSAVCLCLFMGGEEKKLPSPGGSRLGCEEFSLNALNLFDASLFFGYHD